MRILIVTAWYRPFIHPRAHRWTVLAEHWASEGHEVHVVCARYPGHPGEDVVNGVRVHRSGFDSLKELVFHGTGLSDLRRGRVGERPSRAGWGARLFVWMYRNIWKRLCFPDDACFWYFPARKKVGQLLEAGHFDLLISVSLPFTGHLIGLYAAKKRRDRVGTWLADIGDPYSIHDQIIPLSGAFKRRFERQVLEAADTTTATTDFTLQRYEQWFGREAVRRMRVIPPLLHPKPEEHLPIAKTPADPIRLGYFGALYAPVRTPDAFLSLLQKTLELRPDLQNRLEVHFYGEIFPEFFEHLSTIPQVTLHGLRSRTEVQTAMRRMDVLVNIGNTTDYQLPSKAVEYLAANRPVLNLSFVENDPFAHFFRVAGYTQHERLLNLRADNGFTNAVLQEWLDWIEKAEKTRVPDWNAQTEPYLVASIAAQYLSAMRDLNVR